MPSRAHAPAPRLGELADQLLLPDLLRAGGAAARPDRLVAALVLVIVVLFTAISLSGDPRDAGGLRVAVGQIELAVSGFSNSLLRADFGSLTDRFRLLLIEAPETAIRSAPGATAGLVTVFVLFWGIAGLYISRGAGMELGRRIRVRPGRLFTFLRVRGVSAVLSLLLPPLIVSLLLLAPLVLGAMMRVPGLDIAAGLLYGLGLASTFAAAFLVVAWLVAGWMLIPSVACDGADPFDATQRSFGMLLSRPLGVLTHAAVAVLQGVVLIGLVWIVADLAIGFAETVSGAAGERATWIASGIAAETENAGSARNASHFVIVWKAIAYLLVAAYGVSYAHTASTAVYLNARKMVDGQEPSELWMPGDAAGVVPVNADRRPASVRSASDQLAAVPAPADADPGSSEPRG